MAIQLYCPTCKTYNPTSARRCAKCEKPFPHKEKKYRVDVSLKGQRVTRFAGNITLAREIESTIKSDLLRGEFDISHHKPRKEITLGQLWGKYEEWGSANKKSFRTDKAYYHKHIEPRFANKPMSAITPLDLERMKLEMKKDVNMHGKPYAAQTIKHQIVLIRRLFNLASKWGLYQGSNPVSAVQMPKIDNQRCEYLSDEETDRLLQTLDKWPDRNVVVFVMFALLTGVRRSEMFRLTWDCIDFDKMRVQLRDPKGGKTTTIPVSADALATLQHLPRSSEFVFPGKNGKQRVDFKGPWLRIRKAAQLPEGFRFHGLRHNFGSRLVSSGVDLAVIRELMTHKDMSTTLRYAHMRPDVIEQTARKSAGVLVGGKPSNVIELKR